MGQQVQAKDLALTQTELDLANAVVLIQERDAELANTKPNQTAPITIPLTANDADNADDFVETPAQAGFGTSFPTNPQKGDMFLRVDYLPNRLYKWNGQKWIELEKTTNDHYAFDDEYIKYITEKILRGEYSMDDLTKAEQEEVLKRLTHDQKRRL